MPTGGVTRASMASYLALPCVLLRQLRLCSGLFALSRRALHFLPDSEQLLDGARERSWPLSRLR